MNTFEIDFSKLPIPKGWSRYVLPVEPNRLRITPDDPEIELEITHDGAGYILVDIFTREILVTAFVYSAIVDKARLEYNKRQKLDPNEIIKQLGYD